MAAEAKLKEECRDYITHALDGRLVNIKALSWNGFPDSLLLVPQLQPVFIEFKRHGKKPRKNQTKWGEWLLGNGFKYWLVNDWDLFLDFVNNYTENV